MKEQQYKMINEGNVLYKRLVSQANSKLCFSQIKYIFFFTPLRM